MLINITEQIRELRAVAKLDQTQLAHALGTSLVAIDRWERGDLQPSPAQAALITKLLMESRRGLPLEKSGRVLQNGTFASRGSTRRALNELTPDLFSSVAPVRTNESPGPSILSRIKKEARFFGNSKQEFDRVFQAHERPAVTPKTAAFGATSAGKNTYTYDAHTYHTKVPPQGIVEFFHHYLPEGGLALDPFSGSGMTGVAARMAGVDIILNELSPAACFIAHNFTQTIDPMAFADALRQVLKSLRPLRERLYGTQCRECGKVTETLYTVWSYLVTCPQCQHEFRLWDHCRKYGNSVREHKILSEFPCPSCKGQLKKATLKRRDADPVLLGYKCCSRLQIEHPLTLQDCLAVHRFEADPPLAEGYYPITELPDGVNLNQPKKHGLTTVNRFYTGRNLTALSHLWREIHRIADDEVAAILAFAFTSLYQRVTRLSEFRFWGGSGNTARFNVPFIFNEANVFVTFERKAASILDHLETTAVHYHGERAVVCNSATQLDYLADESIDFIFTDPPFGANINYSDMNFLWESWLGEFTDIAEEAIVNRVQGKGVEEYKELMSRSLAECFRVLRRGHWMLLVFMNSSSKVWDSLRTAVSSVGFVIEKVDIFDKQHQTFKQFVSENTAGCDLVLHCRKPHDHHVSSPSVNAVSNIESIRNFFTTRKGTLPTTVYLHVTRDTERDMRMLFSEWVAYGLLNGHDLADFATFRAIANSLLDPS